MTDLDPEQDCYAHGFSRNDPHFRELIEQCYQDKLTVRVDAYENEWTVVKYDHDQERVYLRRVSGADASARQIGRYYQELAQHVCFVNPTSVQVTLPQLRDSA